MFMIEWKPTPSIEELNKNYLDEYCRCFHSNVVATIGYCVATPVYKRYYKYLGDCIKSVMQLDVAEINGNKNFERLCRDLHKTDRAAYNKVFFPQNILRQEKGAPSGSIHACQQHVRTQ